MPADTRRMLSLLLLLAACVWQLDAATLRGSSGLGSSAGGGAGKVQAADDVPATRPRGKQQANTALALLGDLVLVPSEAVSFNPAHECSMEQLLAWSDNAVAPNAGTVPVGGTVVLMCAPGFLPRSGSRDPRPVRCVRDDNEQVAYWDARLSCGLGCPNAALVTASGAPLEAIGLTLPGAAMPVLCATAGVQNAEASCLLDGTWAPAEPCKLCKLTDLLAGYPAGAPLTPQLSAAGPVAPHSHVKMTCPAGTYAFPTASAVAVCQPGGTWAINTPLQCHATGCDTRDFFAGEVVEEAAMAGFLLAVGASVTIRRPDFNAEGGMKMGYTKTTCQEHGRWSGLEDERPSIEAWNRFVQDYSYGEQHDVGDWYYYADDPKA